MKSFHERFKEDFNTLSQLADGSFTKRGWSLGLYLQAATRLNDHLTMHHTIEEMHIFPILARRMKEFAQSDDNHGHIASHKAIHEGLERLKTLVHQYKAEPTGYDPTKMRECLDSFREVLFAHLDQEVEDLRGRNLKKHFTLEEIENIV
ncbi:hypothetical protein GYMLUDRAFT_217561 [Collybiopsis luxurians FD-317 M1]|nr:hypothetical protein GYMLUDRAFT_217561 [Collybiopsis luxurians FD-317 M1]